MKILSSKFMVCVYLVLCCLGSTLWSTSAWPKESDWIPLFDGKSTKGWSPRGELVSFKAVNEELHIISENNVWILSELTLTHFVIEAEVKLPDNADGFNSGLGFRLVGEKGKPKGYQCEIDLLLPGGIYGIGLGGWLYPKSEGEKEEYKKHFNNVFKPKHWNKIKVRSVGKRVQTWVNDIAISDIELDAISEGAFGIQHHGKGRLVRFRNLRVKEIMSVE